MTTTKQLKKPNEKKQEVPDKKWAEKSLYEKAETLVIYLVLALIAAKAFQMILT